MKKSASCWLAAPLASCFVACLATLTPTAAHGQDIQWRGVAGERPDAELLLQSPREAALAMQSMVGNEAARRVVVQFSSPMSPGDRQRLSQAGVEILAPLGSHAFFATVHRARLNVDAVAAVNKLQLAQPIEREVKLHHLLRDVAPPQYIVVSEADAGVRHAAEPIIAVNVLFHRDVTREQAMLIAREFEAKVVSQLQSINALVLELPLSQVTRLADVDAVQWLEAPLPALGELNAENRVATQVDQAQELPYDLDGTDVMVMVFDSGTALATHADFSGRLVVGDSAATSNHATHVAGTVGGDGTVSGGELRGMAPNASIVSFGFQWSSGGIFLYTNPGDIEVDYASAINTYGAVIANNSIGTNTANNGFPCSITGEYGLTDTIIDSIVRGSLGAPIRVFWANGNERNTTRCGDEYFTTAPPACAKNHITIGAMNSDDDSITGFTSWGPAGDGRIKPDISAPGCQIGSGVTSTSSSGGYSTHCGTSMASPTAAGIAALILQDFREQFPDRPDMLPSTMKTLLVHNAKDLENVGPDYQTGYGLIQAVDTIEFMRTGNFLESSVQHGQTRQLIIDVQEPGTPIKVTIAWDDPPGTPNVMPALVNDLDLLVTGPDGTFYPWTLDPENPAAPAVRNQPDRLNNIEQVVIDAASPGLWTIQVIGYNVPEGPQMFSLAASPHIVTTTIDFPQGVPILAMPGQLTPLLVRIRSQGESLVTGSAMLNWRVGGGDFVSTPLTSLGDDLFEGMIPSATCSDAIEMYVSVESSLSGVSVSPSGAPSQVFAVETGQLVHLFSDDFDMDQGWIVGAPDDDAVTGIWERANPVGSFVGTTPVQPSDPYVGSMCYITGQHPGGGAGANDVDFGKTTLFSPVIDVQGAKRAEISYVRWYSNSAGANPNNDIFVVDISNDGGQTWVNAETVGPAGPGTAGGWVHHTFAVEDFVELTDQIRVRFVASDYDPQALVEAAVDMFRLRTIECEDTCVADLTGDGTVDVSDLLALLGAWGDCGGASPCTGDLNDDGSVDVSDLLALFSAWGACP